MALSLDLEFKGLPVNSCYISIVGGNFSLSKESAVFTASFRASDFSEPFKYSNFECRYDMTGENPFVQAYEHLKNLEEFEGAKDC